MPVADARAARTLLRTAHLIAIAALYGGHLHGVAAPALLPALFATLLTGAAFAAFEVWRHPVWLVQLRGLATLAKVLLVALVPWWWEGRLVLLTAALVIASVSSHMPGRYRYYSVLHRRAVGSQERG